MADTEKGFDLLHPPLRVSNPGGTKAFQPYPAHLNHGDGSFCVVTSAAHKATTQATCPKCQTVVNAARVNRAAPGDEPDGSTRRGPGRPPRVSDAT